MINAVSHRINAVNCMINTFNRMINTVNRIIFSIMTTATHIPVYVIIAFYNRYFGLTDRLRGQAADLY